MYTHDYYNTGDYDMDYAYSTNGGATFTTGQHLGFTTADEVNCDLRHYRIYPNSYVNACFTKYVTSPSLLCNVYWTWANGPTPTTWSALTKVSDTTASTGTGGQLIYSPHSSTGGGGVVYPHYGPDSLFFDANWIGIEELPPANPNFSVITVNPNPFTNTVKISYQVDNPTRVKLAVYDASGREVKSIVNDNVLPGDYNITWTGNDNQNRTVNNGIYFIRLKTDNRTTTQKLVYTK
jgi:hypothetical protein